jgi:ankyrin repeat protein
MKRNIFAYALVSVAAIQFAFVAAATQAPSDPAPSTTPEVAKPAPPLPPAPAADPQPIPLAPPAATAPVEMQRPRTPLFDAAAKNDAETVDRLLRDGADPNETDPVGDRPLDIAARNSAGRVLELLLAAGAQYGEVGGDATQATKRRATSEEIVALFEAAANDDADTVKRFLDKGVSVEAQNASGMRAIHIAARKGALRVLDTLLAAGAQYNVEADLEVYSAPIELAYQAGQMEAAARLRKVGATISLQQAAAYGDVGALEQLFIEEPSSIKEQMNAMGQFPIHISAKFGKLEAVKFFLDRGVRLDIPDLEGNTPLYLAVKGRFMDVVSYLIDKGANINDPVLNGATMLHLEARQGNNEEILSLLKLGSDVNLGDSSGRPPIFHAAEAGHKDTVELLIANGARIFSQDVKGDSILHVVGRAGLPEMVEFLIAKGADVQLKDKEGNIPLHAAAEAGQRDVVALYLTHGVQVDARNRKYVAPIHLAAKEGRVDTVEFLLSRGAEMSAKDRIGNTPLHLAAEAGQILMVDYFLTRSANIETPNNYGRTPLYNALTGDKSPMVRALVEKGANVSAMDRNGQTPIFVAVQADHCDLVELLFSKGADAKVVDKRGQTALHSAAHRGCLENTRMLIERGVDVNKRDDRDMTAIHVAAQRGNLNLVKFLVSRGADIHGRDKNGRMPIHLAAREGHLGSVQLLTAQGADINAQDGEGNTALHLAAIKGNTRMVAYLLRRPDVKVNIRNANSLTPLQIGEQSNMNNVVVLVRPVVYLAFEKAARSGDMATMKTLLEAYPNYLNIRVNGSTPLQIAAYHGQKDMVLYLLEAGSLINEVNNEGKNALQLAQSTAKIEIIKILEEKMGIAPAPEKSATDSTDPVKSLALVSTPLGNSLLVAATRKDVEAVRKIVEEHPEAVSLKPMGFTALHLAARAGATDVVELLLDKGADVNSCAETADASTPLQEAVIGGARDMVVLLARRGANLEAKDNKGRTAMDIAKEQASIDIIETLQFLKENPLQ